MFFGEGVVLHLEQVLQIVFLVIADNPIPSLISEQLSRGARVLLWGWDLLVVRIEHVERELFCSQLDAFVRVIVVGEEVPRIRDGHATTVRPAWVRRKGLSTHAAGYQGWIPGHPDRADGRWISSRRSAGASGWAARTAWAMALCGSRISRRLTTAASRVGSRR